MTQQTDPTEIVRLNPDGLFDPTELGFSSVVIVPPGASTVYIAGKLASNQEAGFATQVAESFDSLRRSLEAAGASMETVTKITCLIVDADSDRIEAVTAARLEHFGDHRPVSTIIPVPRLVSETALFEIDAIAVTEQSPNIIE